MGRKSVDFYNLRLHGYVAAMNLDLVATVDERPTARTCGLVTDEKNGIIRVG